MKILMEKTKIINNLYYYIKPILKDWLFFNQFFNMKQLTLLILILFTTQLFSQSNKQGPFIEVNGFAKLEIVPDQIYIAITIHEKWEGKEKITIDSQEQKLKTELTNLGVDLKYLELSDENADYIKIKWTKKNLLAKTKYVLMVKDAQAVKNVFKKLSEIKIYDAEISRVSHSKIEEYKEEVRIKAIKNAKIKANYLLNAIDETVGKAIIVKENLNNEYQQMRPYAAGVYRPVKKNVSSGYLNENDSYSMTINFQKITLTSSIYVKFLIA